MNQIKCELCEQHGGDIVFQSEKWRVVLVDDAGYPGFCRVIWNRHVAEMTDLRPSDQAEMMEAVWRVEKAIRSIMRPDKVNLASLGNVVPHLHWHVIPRFLDDAQFPAPIWAEPKRKTAQPVLESRVALLQALRTEIVRSLENAPVFSHAG